MLYSIAIVLALFHPIAQAEFDYLDRSESGLLMGDAYMTLVDDESTLFYNPAALGRNEGMAIQGLTLLNLHWLDMFDINISAKNFKFDYGKDIIDDFPNETDEIIEEFLDLPFHVQYGLVPTIKLQHFSLSFLYNTSFDLRVENAIHPEFVFKVREDRGAVLGYAYTFGKKGKKGLKTSIGIAAKNIYRRGIDLRTPLLSPQFIEIFSNVDDGIKGMYRQLGYAKGEGTGFDAGIEFNYYKNKKSRLSFGASALDIGDIKFKAREGVRKLPPQRMSVNFGASWEKKFKLFDYAIALDYSNLVDPYTPNLSKIKLGLRTRFPGVHLHWGFNGGHFSWGVLVKVLSLQLKFGFYGIEIGHDFQEKAAKRAVLSIDFFSANF